MATSDPIAEITGLGLSTTDQHPSARPVLLSSRRAPIGNPGLASIRAAADPAPADYLYYVRKPDKIHHFFTADDEEFCRKAREYGYSC